MIRADCTIPVREVERLREIANLAAEFCESMREYAREQVDLSARGPDLAKDQTCYADKLMDEINEFCWELEALRAALEGK